MADLNESYFFQDKDQLIIGKKSNDIAINGEVIKSSIVKYKGSGLKFYLNKAGINSNGSKKEILVIYPNKDVSATKNILFFRKYPKITPGSEILVGKKPERAKISTQELIGISSGLSTLVIVLSSLLSP